MRFPFLGRRQVNHERFRELCCLSVHGQISDDEQAQLDQHLAKCPDCREAFSEFESIARFDLPALKSRRLDSIVNQSMAEVDEVRLLEKVLVSGDRAVREANAKAQEDVSVARIGWKWKLGLSYLTAATALVALAFVVIHSRRLSTKLDVMLPVGSTGPVGATPALTMTTPVEDASQIKVQQESLRAEKTLDATRARLSQEISLLDRLEQDYRTMQARAVAAEDQVAQKDQQLSAENAELNAAKENIGSAEARVAGLQAQLLDATTTIKSEEQRNEVASLEATAEHASITTATMGDSDARELLGARDLHIMDVYDTDRNGKRSRTFGRIYYVNNKLLLFYAFDLSDGEKRRPIAFQAWGYQQPDSNEPESLGLFYADDPKLDRWVLRVSDPKILSRIDAVFVTIEPPTGSKSPRGRELLFAALSGPPNHP